MLEVRNLSVAYGAHRALEDVSIRVAAGEICVILGANGAGKSSLLKAIGAMVRSAPGTQILIDGKDITRSKPHKVVEAGLALVPEGRGIFGDLTVAENLQLGAYGPQAREHEAKRREEVLRLFPRLDERRSQIARTMSGGEQQMVAIGRALMSNPTILMLDEPSLGLSPLLTKDLFKSLKAVRETGVGILLVEQNAKQSLAIADRGYLIENGHITGEGTGADLAQDPAVQAAYLGGAAAAPKSHPHPQPEVIMREEHRRYYVPAGAVGDAGRQPAMAADAAQRQIYVPAGAIGNGHAPADSSTRSEHRQFYVPAGAVGNGAHSDRVEAADMHQHAEIALRPEHRQFYVPAGAIGGGAGPAAGSGGQIAAAHPSEMNVAARAEHRQFYVPAGAAGNGGHVNGHANGHAQDLAKTLAKDGEAIIMSNQAHDLSVQAAEFVKKAASIQRQHVEAQRAEHRVSATSKLFAKTAPKSVAKAPVKKAVSSSASDLGRQAQEMAARASLIQREHVAARRAIADLAAKTAGLNGKKLKGRSKKLAKKAEKLARKAEKLAEKALRAI